MNERQQFLATMLFDKPDRIPFQPGGGRKSTRERWHREGLPEDVANIPAYTRKVLGIEPLPNDSEIDIGVDFRMIPQFEEKVLERHPAEPGSGGHGTLVVQDWKGNVCRISDEFDVSYLRSAIDFVTRAWIKCPVETRQDWEQMKTRYAADAPGHLPADFLQRATKLRDRSYPSSVAVNGPFWQLREWLGFENLCMMFLDDPAWVKEMIAFWQDYVSGVLDRVLKHHVPDRFLVGEDMAYKVKPMIGPDMSREFLAPCWRAWTDQVRRAGVRIVDVDSDGYVGGLIPVWIEAGFNANCPQEVAAGNDLPAYRTQFGTKMAYWGGVDKRKIAAGGKAMEDEMARLIPAIRAGGFIPSCDHGIPSDVSWPNYLHYCRLLAQATGWL